MSRLLNIRTGVQWKLTLLVTVLVLCTSASLFWYFARNERQSQLQSLLIYGRSLARVLAANSEDAVLRQDSDALRKTVEQTSREPDVAYASVSDSTGRFRVQAGTTPAPDVGGNASAPAEQQVGAALFDISAPVARKRLDFTASEPSDLPGAQQGSDTTLRLAGVARIGLSLARIDAAIEGRRLAWILITFLLAAIGGGATHLLMTRLASVRAPTREDATSESDWEHEAELRSRELRESLDQQAATSAILRIIASSASDLQPALDAVAEHAARLCGATDAQIYLVTGADLQWIAGFGPLPVTRAESVPIRPTLVSGKAILERCSVHIQDAARELEEFPDSKLIRSRIGYRTMLVTPLLWQGAAIGVIIIRRMQMHPFSDTQIELLKTFADQSAIAIENTRLFHELRVRNQALTEALDQQTASTEVLRAISSSPTNLQRVLDEITRNVAKLCDGVDAYVARVEDDTFVVTSVHGSPLHLLTGERLPLRRDLVTGRAILEARTVHVADILAESDTDYAAAKAVRSRSGYRSMLAAPLLQRGAAIGAIGVGRQDVRPFTDEQVRLLESFADQAVIAIENTRLFEDLETRNSALTEALERQAATGEVLQIISSSPSQLQAVFDAICGSSVRLCDGLNSDLYQFDGELIHFSAHANFTPEALQATRKLFPVRPSRDSAVARAIFDGDVVHIPDVTKDLDYRNLGWASTIGVRSALAVPMVREGRPIGVIAVNRTEPTPFSETQIELLKTFARQAVIAIENARLFEALEHRNKAVTEALEQQTATSEILRVISGSPTDAGPVFETIVQSAPRLCGAEFAVLHRYDGERVTADAYHSLTEQELDVVLRVFPRPAQREYAAGRAILNRDIVHIPDIHEDPEYQISDSLSTTGYTAVLAVPLLKEGTAVGALCLWRRSPSPFSETQIALVKTFADQAVIAIENVRLFNELGERNRALTEALEQQTALSEVLRVFSNSPTDIKPVLEAVVRSAAKLCHAKHAIIFRVEGDSLRSVKQYGSLSPIAEDGRLPLRRDLVAGRAVMERRTMHFADILAEPENELASARELALRMGYRTVVAAPLLRQGEPIGVIGVWRTEVRPFSDSEVALLETFADQAVIAIENVRLFNELQDRNEALTESLEQQTATSEILRVMSSSPTDLQPVIEAIAENAARLCGNADGAVNLVEGDHFVIAARSEHSPSPLGAHRPIRRDFMVGRSLLDNTVLHMPDLQQASKEEFGAAVERAHQFGYRAALAVPMVREGTPIGVLWVSRKEPVPFSETQIELVKTFADQAVIAIENVRLFKELQERNKALTEALEQQTATSDILRVISSSPTDLQPVLDAVAASASRLSGGSHVSILRIDGDALTFVAESGPVLYIPLGQRLPIGRDVVAGRAIIELRPIHVADIQAESDADYATAKRYATVADYRAILAVPMLREGEPLGVIVARRREAGMFSDTQVALMQTFADQAVIAIENVRLFQELETRTQELAHSVEKLQALAAVSEAINSTLDLQKVLETIAARATQLSSSSASAVYEFDEESQSLRLRATHGVASDIVEVMLAKSLRLGEGVNGRAALERVPVQVDDIQTTNAYSGVLREIIDSSELRAVLVVPMLREGRVVGTLSVSRKTVGSYPLEVVELLQTVAAQSTLAIQNARLFREIERKSRELLIASQHKSQFLANMSHELRTPLNAILGYTELIVDKIYGDVPERISEVLERVQKSGRHLLALINEVLDLSKIEAGQLTLELSEYSFNDVAQAVVSAVGSLAAEKQLLLSVNVAADLPVGRGDERRITQVLLNLVGNAIKFTEKGEVAVRVSASAGTFLVAVRDTGPGIREEDRQRIFEEFQQSDSSPTKTKGGTGLGLAIAKRIVEMHGGRIWVESSLGHGSTFFVSLPVLYQRQEELAR